MILFFSGDPFLARRAARAAVRERGGASAEVVVLREEIEPQELQRVASQGSLFGQVALLLDFDEAFSGQAGVQPRNQAIAALERLDASALVVVLDSAATPARHKRYRKLGRLTHLPTPRFERLSAWAGAELKAAGVRHEEDVPRVLAELFGEDPAAIASEIAKLAALDEVVSGERVRVLANRPAANTAFDLIEKVADGDAAAALTIARGLLQRGEAPQRVLGALSWQFGLVARGVAVQASAGGGDAHRAIAELGAPAVAARRALAIARRFDEPALRRALRVLVDADRRAKSGGEAGWALEAAVVTLARSCHAADANQDPNGPGDHAR